MMKKPIIGIVGRSDKGQEDYNVICCFESVRRSIIKKGGIPILILPNQDIDYDNFSPKDINRLTLNQKKDLMSIVDLCDGILIPGTYKLFEYDKFIYEYALEKNIPVLGICGGMQLMALASNKSDTNISLEKNDTIINHFQKGKDYVHKVKIEKNTLLYKIIGKEEIKVNSRHNYHVNKFNDLTICAYSEDGLIEAVEVKNKKFVLGVEWHPESMLEYDEDANKIIEAFIRSCQI